MADGRRLPISATLIARITATGSRAALRSTPWVVTGTGAIGITAEAGTAITAGGTVRCEVMTPAPSTARSTTVEAFRSEERRVGKRVSVRVNLGGCGVLKK